MRALEGVWLGVVVLACLALAQPLGAQTEEPVPVLLHCGSGNRVGALLALAAFHVDGRPADAALQYGLDSGLTRLEPVVRDHLSAAAGQ